MTKSKLSMFAFGILSLMGLFFFMCVTANAAAPTGTISYWRLDEAEVFDASAATYEDSVDTNHGDSTGTTPSESPAPTAGRVGVGQTFGAATGINVLAAPAFDFLATDSFSIECWMKGTGNGTQVFVGRNDPDPAVDLQWWLGTRAPGVAAFSLFKETEGDLLEGLIPLDDTKFHHVVAVRDGSTGEHRLYVDGQPDISKIVPFTKGFASTVDLNIGYFPTGFHYVGDLDEIAIYDTALSDDEVLAHFNAGIAGDGIDPPTPPPAEAPPSTISYWKLDEAEVFDASAATYEDSVDTNHGDSTGTTPSESPAPAAGRVGVGQTFGAATGINVLAAPAFDFLATDSFSIECWMKGTGNGTQVFVGRNDPDPAVDLQWWLGTRAPGVAAFSLFKETEGDLLEGLIPLDDTKFHHVVAVRDGSTGEHRLYVDGQPDISKIVPFTKGFASTVDLNIGYFPTGFHYVGDLDEIAIYDTALSDDEVLAHFNAGIAGDGIDTLDPIPAPVAVAVADPTNPEENIEVTLDGTGSTPVGTLSYLWEQVPPGTSVTLTGALTATAKFTPPVGTAGEELTFKLTVTDDFDRTDDETVKVTVAGLPDADAGDPQSVTEGDPVTLDGRESTPKGMISYLWEQVPPGTQVLPAAGVPAATADFTAPQVDSAGMILTFKLTVTDGLGQTDDETVKVTVNDNPLAPTADAGDDQDAKEGNTVTLDGSSSIAAAGSTITTYLWEQVLPGTPVQLAGASTDTATFTAPDVDETLTFRLTVTDDNNLTSSATTNVNVSKSGGGGGGGGGGCFINSMF